MAIPAIPRSPRTGLPLIPKGAGRRTCRCDEAAPALLRTGIAQFNNGDYWECHETLEELWRGEPDPVRYLYQGILLAGVGLHSDLLRLISDLDELDAAAPMALRISCQ